MFVESVDSLMADTHELGGSNVVVDRATPKASYSTVHFILFLSYLYFFLLSMLWLTVHFFSLGYNWIYNDKLIVSSYIILSGRWL